MTARLVVLVSGNGSNLQALLDASASGSLEASVEAVVSNNADAFGLTRAAEAGVATAVVERLDDARPDYDRRLADVVAEYQPDLVILAGWMRLLSSAFLNSFDVINLHPALPGEFAGTNAIERAFEAWQHGDIETSGVMVHWVPDEGVDDGPVIATAEVPFATGDTLETFEQRMHGAEHALLVAAVQQVVSERAREKARS